MVVDVSHHVECNRGGCHVGCDVGAARVPCAHVDGGGHRRLDVGSLEEHDFEESDFTAIATAAEVVDSMQAHIATLSRDDLVDILSNS